MIHDKGYRRRISRVDTGELFPNAFTAANALGHSVAPRDIVAWCKGDADPPPGMQWRYHKPRPGEAGYVGPAPSPERAAMIFHSTGRCVRYPSLVAAARDTGVDTQTLRRAIRHAWMTKQGIRAMWVSDYDETKLAIPPRPVAREVIARELGRRYPNVEEAERALRFYDPPITAEAIVEVCEGLRHSTNGLHWRYGDIIRAQPVTRPTLQRGVIAVDSAGLVHRFASVRAASNQLNIAAASISHVLAGRRARAGGMMWRHDQES